MSEISVMTSVDAGAVKLLVYVMTIVSVVVTREVNMEAGRVSVVVMFSVLAHVVA